MVQLFAGGDLHGGAQDAGRLPWQPLGGLPQQLQARVRDQGVRGAGALEGVLDESGEALALADGLQVKAHVQAPGEGGVRGASGSSGVGLSANRSGKHRAAWTMAPCVPHRAAIVRLLFR